MPVYHRDPCLTLLFKFNVNDLNYFVCNMTLRLYGDDATECASDASPVVLQLILARYQAGFESNSVNIDAPKTQAVAIWPSQYEHEFHLNDRTVET